MANKIVDFASLFEKRLLQITQLTKDTTSPTLSFEALLDAFLAIYTDCKGLANQTDHVQNFISRYDKILSKIQSLRVNTQDFEVVQTLATGAVGKVCLVREKKAKTVYAMKILKKTDLLSRREAAFFMEERDALVFAQSSPWITTLYSAFQDEDHLYLVMEYASGGSVRALINKREKTMDEDEARFYVGEMLIALDELHKLNFIHRDVKPENCLIDNTGHLKLADFGSAMAVDDEKRITSGETVGTPDYISPEILRALEGNVSYGFGCDWWSLGIILYELVFDEVPFYADSLAETYGKIMDHEKHFAFPDDIEISDNLSDLLKGLICSQEKRLGKNGAQEIKDHPWFKGFNWTTIRQTKAPFIPELSGPDDTRYFEDEEDESKKITQKSTKKIKDFSGHNLPFVGYTYVQNANPVITLHRTDGKESSAALMMQASSLSTTTTVSTITTNMASSSAVIVVDNGKVLELEEEILKLKEALKAKVGAFSISEAKREKEGQLEIECLKRKLEEENNSKHLIEDRVAQLFVEKNALESELGQTKLDILREKEEMEGKLAGLKFKLDKEVRVNMELKESESSNLRMEKEIEKLKLSIEERKLFQKKSLDEVSELTKTNAFLVLDIDQIKRQQKDDEESFTRSSLKVEELSKLIESLKEQLSVLEREKSRLFQSESKVKIDLAQIESKLAESLQKNQSLFNSNIQIEKEKTILSVELNSALNKAKELSSQTDAISRKLNEKEESHQKSESGVKESIQSLSTDLQKVIQTNNRLHEENMAISKEKALLDHELIQQKLNFATLNGTNSELKTKFELERLKISEIEGVCQSLNFKLETTQKSSNEAQTEIVSLTQQLRESRKVLNISNLKVGSLEKLNTTLTNDFADFKAKASRFENIGNEMLEKVKEFELSLNAERRTRLQTEISLKTSQQLVEQQELEIQRLREKLATMKTYQSSFEPTMKTLQYDISVLKESKKTDHMQYTEKTKKIQTELTREHEKVAKSSEIIKSLTENNANLLQKVEEYLTKMADEEVMVGKLANQLLEYEYTIEQLKEKLDEPNKKFVIKSLKTLKNDNINGAPSSKSLGNLIKDKTTENTKSSKSKLNFFGKGSSSSSQHAKEEREKTLQKIQDLEDEFKSSNSVDVDVLLTAAPNNHIRKTSEQSVVSVNTNSIRSGFSGFKSFETSPVIYDFSNGLKGWLKIPKKQGNIRKGWKKVFAIVKDFKIYTYEKEKDIDEGKHIDVIDMRCGVFYSKSVTQAEVIHANSKDIDSIFKLHFTQRDISPIRNSLHSSPVSITKSSDMVFIEPIKEIDPLDLEFENANRTKRVNSVLKLKRLSSNMIHTSLAKSPSVKSPGPLKSPSLLHASTANPGSLTSETSKKISQLQVLVNMEEKYLNAAQQMLGASYGENQRNAVSQQIELYQKNIKEWKETLDKLIADYKLSQASKMISSSATLEELNLWVVDQDTADWKKELEDLLKKKFQEKEGILKIIRTKNVGLHALKSSTMSNEADGLLAIVDRDILMIKEDLENLSSGDRTKIENAVKTLNEKAASNACNGHFFKKRIIKKRVDCGQCRETLWAETDTAKTVMECEICHALCHNYCKLNFHISCSDYTLLKDIQPLYFMANDAADRNKWLAGIEYFMKETERLTYSSLPGSPVGSIKPLLLGEIDIPQHNTKHISFVSSSPLRTSGLQLDFSTTLPTSSLEKHELKGSVNSMHSKTQSINSSNMPSSYFDKLKG